MKTKAERIREMIVNEINIEKLVSEIEKIMATSERSPENKETVAKMLQQIDEMQAEEYNAEEEYNVALSEILNSSSPADAELHFKKIKAMPNI